MKRIEEQQPETQIATTGGLTSETIAKLALDGDLKNLTNEEMLEYYKAICARVGLDPVARPFTRLELDGKEILYCTREGTSQLSNLHKLTRTIVSREEKDGCYIVTAKVTTPDGRSDEAIGAVSIEKEEGEWVQGSGPKKYFRGNGIFKKLRGDALCNAIMKAESKAKRRATLDLVGLGMLDESEIESIRSSETERGTITESTVVSSEAKRMEQAGIDPEKAKPFVAKTEPEKPKEEKQVEGKVVETPVEKTVTAPVEKAPDPIVEKAPETPKAKSFAEMTEEELPESEKWRAHKITQIQSRSFNNIRLDTITLPKLEIAMESWVNKFADKIAEVPEKAHEAALIKMAYEVRKAQNAGEWQSDEELFENFSK